MGAQHTPGPWEAEDQTGSVPFWAVYGADRRAIVYATLRDADTLAANARLIAEAPAMLAALQEARDALHFHYVEWDGEPEDAVPLLLARSKIDDILNRIDGGAAW